MALGDHRQKKEKKIKTAYTRLVVLGRQHVEDIGKCSIKFRMK
jgi:hypothetical protein